MSVKRTRESIGRRGVKSFQQPGTLDFLIPRTESNSADPKVFTDQPRWWKLRDHGGRPPKSLSEVWA